MHNPPDFLSKNQRL